MFEESHLILKSSVDTSRKWRGFPQILISAWRNILKTVRPLGLLASPFVFISLTHQAADVITLHFVGKGKYGSRNLGAATLGNMVWISQLPPSPKFTASNITGGSLAYGFNASLDALVSQAFGAKAPALAGLYAERAALILTFFCIPATIAWSQSNNILYYGMGITRDTADLAGSWSRIIALGFWPGLMSDVFKRWLQGQQIVWPILCAVIGQTICNLLLNYVIVDIYDMGLEGAALVVALTKWCYLSFLISIIVLREVYMKHEIDIHPIISPPFGPLCVRILSLNDIRCRAELGTGAESLFHQTSADSDHKSLIKNTSANDIDLKIIVNKEVSKRGKYGPTTALTVGEEVECHKENVELNTSPRCSLNLPPLQLALFDEWDQIFRLGLPSALSLFMEWSTFELTAIIAARLGPIHLAVHGIFMTTSTLFSIIPSATALATATLAGTAIGALNHRDAKRFVKVGIFFGILYGVIAGTLLSVPLRPYWASMFTEDKNVRALAYQVMPVMFFYILADSMKNISANILRSTGRPKITAWGNAASGLGIMLPLGWLFSVYFKLGLAGLWLGLGSAWLFSSIIYLSIILATDWKGQGIVVTCDCPLGLKDKGQQPVACVVTDFGYDNND